MVKNEINNGDLILDISTFNKISDYSKVKNLCKGVILRIGYRGYSNGSIQKDKGFARHLDKLIDELPIGVYFLDQSINESEAILQANWTYMEFMNAGLGSTPIPIWLDSEASASPNKTGRGDLISKDQRTKNVLAFCNRMNELGYTAGIYASDSWLKDKLDYEKIKHLPIWNAKYNSNNGKIGEKPTRKVDLWQFTSRYDTDFCSGPLDMNVVLNTDILKKGSSTEKGFYPPCEMTLLDYLAKMQINTNPDFRKKLAAANGIQNYSGTKEQNLKLLDLIKVGKLKKV